MKKISIVIPDLRIGGAERVSINLANTWASQGLDVEFVLMKEYGDLIPYLHPSVTIYNLQSTRIRNVLWPLAKYLREARPDVTLSHMWPLTSISTLAWKISGSPGKLFLCEHISLTEHIQGDLSLPLLIPKLILRFVHPLASATIAVSHGVATDLARLSGISETSIRVIHNPVVTQQATPRVAVDEALRTHLWQGKCTHHLLSIGTLKPQKNHVLLLEAFSLLPDALDARLVILGDGPLRAHLEEKIHSLGLDGRVHLAGFDPQPELWLRSADLFILSSDFEGFANVLAESLSYGTPVVSTNCKSGPSEILHNGVFGALVPVGLPSPLADAILHSLRQPHDPNILIKRAQDFSVSRISEQYLALFSTLDT